MKVYSDSRNDADNFDKTFAKLQVVVLMSQTTVCKGKFPFKGILCIFGVPLKFPGRKAAGYNPLYFFSETSE